MKDEKFQRGDGEQAKDHEMCGWQATIPIEVKTNVNY